MYLYLIYKENYGNIEIIGIYDDKQTADLIIERLDKLGFRRKQDIDIEILELNTLTKNIKDELTDTILEFRKDLNL